VLALAGLLALACGKKGPPLPIVHVAPAAPGPLKVRQIGSDVVLASTLPGTRSDGTRLEADAELRVLRMPATGSLQPGAVSDRYLVQQFDKQARPVASLSGAALAALVLGGRLLFVDHEATTGPPAAPAAGGAKSPKRTGAGPAAATTTPSTTGTAATGTVAAAPRLPRYLYALQVVEPKGRKSPLRSPSLIEVCPSPEAPTDLQLETAEGEVRLDWKPGAASAQAAAPQAAAPPTVRPPADPARPATSTSTTPSSATPSSATTSEGPPPADGAVPRADSKTSFNVYRRLKDELRDPEAPLNAVPLDAPSYIDRTFQYDVEYVYFVRTTTGDKNSTCESIAGPSVEVKPHDRFAPDAPTGLAVAAEGDVIRVYWFPNSEPDLGGYRVYRREGSSTETSFLADVPAIETSFIDSGAKRGVRYYYSVSAVDTAKPINESARSEEKTEMLSGAAAGGSAGPNTRPGGP